MIFLRIVTCIGLALLIANIGLAVAAIVTFLSQGDYLSALLTLCIISLFYIYFHRMIIMIIKILKELL